jgi:hypothetical protein
LPLLIIIDDIDIIDFRADDAISPLLIIDID